MRVRVCSITLMLAAAFAVSAWAQSGIVATAPLREIRADGVKSLPEPQVVTLTGLQTGVEVGKDDLQAAADKLVQSGLFAKVRYNFQSRTDGLLVIFHVEEAPRIPVYFDNLPWFADSELNDTIRTKLPLHYGTPRLYTTHIVRRQMQDITGKPYSRTAIDMFLAEQILPTFLQRGFLRARLGPPEVRLTGNPNTKLPGP